MLNEKELIKVSNKRIIKMKKEEKVNANVKRKKWNRTTTGSICWSSQYYKKL